MRNQKDYIRKIISIKQRNGNYTGSYLPERMWKLEAAFSNKNDLNPELVRYFPIGLIACLEGVVRTSIRELIDFGSPYFDNVASFKKIPFDFEVIHALQQKTITVGDFISHVLPISSFEHINSHMNTLLGEDFLSKLKTVEEKSWVGEEEVTQPMISHPNQVFEGVKKTFELRHIYAHELAIASEPDLKVITNCFTNTKIFIEAITSLVTDLIYPNVSLSTYEMQKKFSEELDIANDEMEKICKQIETKLDSLRKEDLDYSENFKECQKSWENYSDKHAWFLADLFWRNGTGYSIAGRSNAIDLTNYRIKVLRSILDDINEYYE